MAHDTGVCHGQVPVSENELSLRIIKYLMKITCFGAVNYMKC